MSVLIMMTVTGIHDARVFSIAVMVETQGLFLAFVDQMNYNPC